MARHRKLRGRKLKKQRKIIIASVIVITLLLSTGYAAFSTNISLSAKGNIKEQPKPTAAQKITELLSDTTSNLITDDYGNIRYSGKDVNNYVCMENEVTCSEDNLYRIIGVFKDIKTSEDDTEGETRIKVIKAINNGNDSWDKGNSLLGFSYKHNQKIEKKGNKYEINAGIYLAGGGSVSGESNNWTNASLKTTLQSLSIASNSLIEEAIWNIGGHYDHTVTSKDMYNYERGTATGNNNNYPSTWTGKVALMYPSDYGYASSNCYNSKELLYYNDSTCTGSNWLFGNQNDGTQSSEWLLTPESSSSNTAFAVLTSQDGTRLGYVFAYNNSVGSYVIRPSFYLKSNVAIKEDSERNGSEEHPYLLELIEEEN